jgi:nucleoside 2-deoxyribosyltransferase
LKLVYVAGPLFGPNDWEIRRHIHRAAALGYEVAKLGAYPVIPHTNTGSVFVGTMTPEFWYAGTLELLRRCDAVILVTGWEDSKGSTAEFAEARRLNLPVFSFVHELKTWLTKGG